MLVAPFRLAAIDPMHHLWTVPTQAGDLTRHEVQQAEKRLPQVCGLLVQRHDHRALSALTNTRQADLHRPR